MSFTRKTEKQYPKVEFSVDFFEEKFVLPRFDSLPVGVIRTVSVGDLNGIATFIQEQAGDDALEAFDSLSDDEVEQFIDAWKDAENLPRPASAK